MIKHWNSAMIKGVVVGSFNLVVALFCIITAFTLHSSYYMVPNLLLGALNLVCVWFNYNLVYTVYKNLKEVYEYQHRT